jgi:solute carrier family 10 (sodium/bile acid cotransporter), member 7
LKKFITKNWFMLGMPVAVALAWVLPEAGADGGWLKAEVTTKLAVALVFLVQGLTLPAKALKDGASQGRLHVGVQVFGFLVLPLVGLALDQVVGSQLAPDLRLGFLFLCVLPSTIVMAVVLATVAGGNVAAAIFNAVLSNVLGVFLTPLWVAAILASSGASEQQSVGLVLREVSLLLLVPLAVGQVLRRVGFKAWADLHKKRLSNLSNFTILLIVYAAFCNSVKADIWAQHGLHTILIAAIGVAGLMMIALGLAILAARALRLAPPERIVMVISGAQKSLATGVPLAKVIFGAHPGLGLILLPIMIYHPLQLFICGWLAARHVRHQ